MFRNPVPVDLFLSTPLNTQEVSVSPSAKKLNYGMGVIPWPFLSNVCAMFK